MEQRKATTHVIVVSDLHIGGEPPVDLGQPFASGFQIFQEAPAFARFVQGLPELCHLSREDVLELVINGDFIDFLAEKPFEPLVLDQATAVAKLDAALSRVPEVVAALRRLVSNHSLVIVLGNHDLELGQPAVRERLLQHLAATRTSCRFLLDGEAYRVGELLIEHGNRYDPWNITDYGALRTIRSMQSRDEMGADRVKISVSAGSQLVAHILNPMKAQFRFLDLLKPEDAAIALMIRIFRPDLTWLLRKSWWIATIAQRRIASRLDVRDRPTHDANLFSADRAFDFTREECDLLSREIASLSAAGDELGSNRHAVEADLFELVTPGAGELSAIQSLLNKKMGRSARDVQAEVALRLLRSKNVNAVVFGHTHYPSCIRSDDGTYINTGSWTGRLEVPARCLEPTAAGIAQLTEFVGYLRKNGSIAEFMGWIGGNSRVNRWE